MSHLATAPLSRSAKRRVRRCELREEQVPAVVKDDVIFECLENYRRGTIWMLVVCSVCGSNRSDTVDIDIPYVGDVPFSLSRLRIPSSPANRTFTTG